MSIVMNLFYTGPEGQAKEFAKEMVASGLVAQIRNLEGNLGYDYYLSLENPNTILLIDKWANQAALDRHHALNMARISELREKYHLTVTACRYEEKAVPAKDSKYLKES